jgi:serine/threonine protein kinase/N-acetylneuraminic acid mutarotase
MSIPSPAELLTFLQEHGFLTTAQVQQVGGGDGTKPADARPLARELVDRDWLTPFQANQLLLGRGEELLLGPYRILDRLGEGGMGQVFKAHHVSMDRTIALKIIAKDRVSDRVAVARFYREVRAVAKLSHPNIVTAFEVNQIGETHLLAMEYVGGIDLARLVRQSGPLSIPNACEYIRQAAVGLQHAHEKGLVHRDIKPGNLIVARPNPDEPPVVKILDFGLARFESESAQAERLTQLGKIVGTVDYIAPEQAQNARTADIRADIYSLGCSLFYLLTGQPPFAGEDAVEKIGARVLGDAPSVRGGRPEVSPALELVLAKMMARNPADRYQTPGEVAKALEPHTDKAGQAPAKAALVPERPAVHTARPVAATAKTEVEVGKAALPTQLAKTEMQMGFPPRWDQRKAGRRPLVAIVAAAFVAGSVLALLVAGGIVFWLNWNDDSGAPSPQALAKTSGTEGPSPPVKTQPKIKPTPGPDKTVTAKESKQPILDPKQPTSGKDTDPDQKKGKTDTPEKPAPLPRLVAFPKLTLPPRGTADLQVKVDRQGYAGPIKVQVANLPPGVTCQSPATIPPGESSVRIEFRTDGTAAEGTATVEVIATADAQNADRQKLALLLSPPTTWKSLANMPTARILLAAVTGPDGRIYAIGGENASGRLDTVEVYDPHTDKWSTVASMPTARNHLAATMGPDHLIYAIGGVGGPNIVEAYNPRTNKWTRVADMPSARHGLAAATGPDGRIYVIGGSGPGGAVNTVEAYDTKSNTWATVANMPTARVYLAAATGPDGRIYAIGGFQEGDGKRLNTVEAYDTKTNKWATVASMPTARNALAAATGPDGHIYAIGGHPEGGNLNPVEAYDPSTNKWTTVAGMPTVRGQLAATTGRDGRIYAIGGGGTVPFLNTVEALSLSTSK